MHNNFPTEDNFPLGCHWTSVTNNNFFHNYSLPQEHTNVLWTTETCRPKLFTKRSMQLLLERSNKAFSMRCVQASCGHPPFKENLCILRMSLYWLFIGAHLIIAHFGYLVLKSWLKALDNLSITGMVWFVHALKKKRKKRKKKKKSERKTLKKGNKIKK